MRCESLIGACLLALSACAQPQDPQTSTLSSTTASLPPSSPLVDGLCDEYSALGAEPIAVSEEVELFIHQNAHSVWLCYSYPEGSFGMMEMFIDTDALPEPLTLHVSAQLGEWPTDQPELAPQEANSDLWWNHSGWVSNAVWFNGMDRSGDRAEVIFKSSPAREIQLSKARFGRGDWQFRLEIRGIRTADGTSTTAEFPSGGEVYILSAD